MTRERVVVLSRIAVVFLLAIFALSGCSEAMDARTGDVEIRIVTPRSVDPGADIVLSRVMITGQMTNDSSKTLPAGQVFDVGQPIVIRGLTVGQWTLTVTGLNADNVALTSQVSDTVAIAPGQRTSASFSLSYLSDGSGDFTYTVTLPSTIDSRDIDKVFTAATLVVKKVGDTTEKSYSVDSISESVVFNATQNDGSDDLSVGEYTMSLVLTNKSGTTVTFPNIDFLSIYNQLVSTGSLVLSEDDFFVESVAVSLLPDHDESQDDEGSNVVLDFNSLGVLSSSGAQIYYTYSFDSETFDAPFSTEATSKDAVEQSSTDVLNDSNVGKLIKATDNKITISKTTWFKVVAVCENSVDSAVTSHSYTINGSSGFDVAIPASVVGLSISQSDGKYVASGSAYNIAGKTITGSWKMDGAEIHADYSNKEITVATGEMTITGIELPATALSDYGRGTHTLSFHVKIGSQEFATSIPYIVKPSLSVTDIEITENNGIYTATYNAYNVGSDGQIAYSWKLEGENNDTKTIEGQNATTITKTDIDSFAAEQELAGTYTLKFGVTVSYPDGSPASQSFEGGSASYTYPST